MGALTRRSRPADDLPPGLTRAEAVAHDAVRPLTAAAARVKIGDKKEIELLKARKQKATWQSEAWDYYDAIGEIKYAFMLTGAIMSRMRLYLAATTSPGDPPAPLGDVKDIPDDVKERAEAHFQRLNSGHGGIAGLLREFAVNLSVPGECYLVQQKARPASGLPEQWTIRSTDEIEVDSSGKASLRESRALSGTEGLRALGEDEFISRIWRPHPRFHDEADSSMRALLDLASELLLLNRAVRATAKSRLNAGAMFIPDGLSVAAAPDVTNDDGEVETEEDDLFEQELVAAMTLPIQDEDSASAVVPLLIRGPGELGGQIKQFKFERSFDPALTERADRVLERILQGIDVPKDIVTGLASVKYALSTDSEILTRRGWKTYEEVEVGEDVYTLNHDTGLGEWQPLLEINIHDHDGPMLSMESTTHSSLSTPEHRWAVVNVGPRVRPGTERRWTTSAEGFVGDDRIETAVECGNLPTEAKYSDDFVRLVALYTSDGWVERPERGALRANVTKSGRNRNPQALSTIRTTLATVDPGHREYDHRSSTPDGRPVVGVRFRLSPEASEALFAVVEGREKVVSFDFIASLTYAQLNLFLDSLIAIGDGNLVNGRMDIRRYWQTEKKRLEPIAMAGVLAGYAVRWLPKPIRPGKGALVSGSRPCWGLTVTKASTRVSPYSIARRGNANWEHYEGKVWCPTTSNHTWLARRNGKVFLTGNSNAVVINESLYRAHIEPLTLVICDALTMTYLRPALKAMDIDDDIVDRAFVWYDPSDILTSADRATNANEGWDRYLLSGSAWRSAHGFAETDAPSGEELVKRIAISRGQITADLTEALLQQIAPGVLKAIREGSVGEQGPGVPQGLQDLLNEGKLPEQGEPLPPEILEGLPTVAPSQAPAEAPEAPAPEPEPANGQEPGGVDLPFPDIFASRRVR